ncbi:rRNA maturation RNAse YbeY, partial [Francisella tularensis subsp. holarctica]|uniref:rRNA maturation RNAse YbeY n=1 Tax=Francisella tularensis TaxID=263 RepID=UPI002381947D
LHFFIHGLLLLLGYDHLDDQEAEVMDNLEIQLLAHLGIANPYIEQDNQIGR